jgi:hypothetical protein
VPARGERVERGGRHARLDRDLVAADEVPARGRHGRFGLGGIAHQADGDLQRGLRLGLRARRAEGPAAFLGVMQQNADQRVPRPPPGAGALAPEVNEAPRSFDSQPLAASKRPPKGR